MDDKSVGRLSDDFADALGLDRIQWPKPIDETVRLPRDMGGEITPAATPDDQLAREAVAEIERADGYHVCAEARLRGAYDGDTEHRIALAAIRRARQFPGGGGAVNASPSDK